MLTTGKIQIATKLKKFKINRAAMQKTKWKGRGSIDGKYFTIRYSGDDAQGHNFRHLRDKDMDFRHIREIRAYIRIETKPYNSSLLNVYGPTSCSDNEDRDK